MSTYGTVHKCVQYMIKNELYINLFSFHYRIMVSKPWEESEEVGWPEVKNKGRYCKINCNYKFLK